MILNDQNTIMVALVLKTILRFFLTPGNLLNLKALNTQSIIHKRKWFSKK